MKGIGDGEEDAKALVETLLNTSISVNGLEECVL